MLGPHKLLALSAPQVSLCANGAGQGSREGGPTEQAGLWSCATRGWLNLPHTEGDWLVRQGKVQYKVKSSHHTNAFIDGLQPHKDPHRERALQPCLALKGYPVLLLVCEPGDGDLWLWEDSQSQGHTHPCSWTGGLAAQKDLSPVPLDCSPLL